MTLKAVVENLDDVPENLREEYTEKDGKFYLDVDDTLKVHLSVQPLANALQTLKNEKKELQSKLTALNSRLIGLPDDFDVNRFNDLSAELDALRKDPNRDKTVEEGLQCQRDVYEQRIQEAEARRITELAEKDGVVAAKEAEIERLIVDEGLTKALVASGVGPQYLRAAQAMLRNTVKMRTNDDGDREAIVETDLGDVSVSKFIDTWSKSDEGKHFVTKPAGGGATGGSGGGRNSEPNPWRKETWNLTRQGQIINSDRNRARRMMSDAGVPDGKIAATLGG